MRAIIVSKAGGPDVLQVQEVDDIAPQRGEVKVRVKAIGINRADLAQREGRYPAPPGTPANILGLEYAGIIEAVGADVFQRKIGDKVFGLVGGGAYAEYVVVHERTTALIPDHLDFIEAAALPEATITAYDALITQCGLRAGEIVLIPAAASGVGTAAIQICHAVGARVIAMTRSESKAERLRDFNPEHTIVDDGTTYPEKVLSLTNKVGVNVVLELVGGSYISHDIDCTSVKGRIILVGMLGGSSCTANLAKVLSKRLTIKGTTLRARPLEEKIETTNVFSSSLIPLFESGKVKAIIDRKFAFEEVSAAHEYLGSNDSFGKVVLTVD